MDNTIVRSRDLLDYQFVFGEKEEDHGGKWLWLYIKIWLGRWKIDDDDSETESDNDDYSSEPSNFCLIFQVLVAPNKNKKLIIIYFYTNVWLLYFDTNEIKYVQHILTGSDWDYSERVVEICLVTRWWDVQPLDWRQ